MQELRLLIIKAQSGDLEAYDQLVCRSQDMAVAYAYSVMNDFHLAEDAAQEAFVEAFLCLPKLQEPLAFPGWLRRIVFKHCDRLTRNKRVSTVTLEAAIDAVSPDCEPHRVMEKKETVLQVRKAIAALSQHERDVIVLFYMGEHSQNQIAEFLEVPVTTVKKRLHTARKKLKEKMIQMIQENLESQRPSRNAEFAERVPLKLSLDTIFNYADKDQVHEVIFDPQRVEKPTETEGIPMPIVPAGSVVLFVFYKVADRLEHQLSFGDVVKEALVEQLKKYQRSGWRIAFSHTELGEKAIAYRV